MIIHRRPDARGGGNIAPGKSAKCSVGRIFHCRNRPKPARESKFLSGRIVDRQQPIAGLEHIDQRTFDIEMTIDICLAETQRAYIAKHATHDVGAPKDQLEIRRTFRLGRPVLPIP